MGHKTGHSIRLNIYHREITARKIIKMTDDHQSLTLRRDICRKIVNTVSTPAAIGPYNQAVMVDKTLYISGQLGMGGYKDVIKTTVLMKDISEFSAVNNIYSNYFKHHQPARAAFQVAALPKGGNIEIEAVAIVGAVDVGSVLLNKTYLGNL